MAMIDVLMWGAGWCKACNEKRPLVEQACREAGVPLTYYDCDDPANVVLAQEHGFKAIPAVAVAVDGRVAYRAVGGLINRPALDAHLSDSAPAAP